MSSRRLFNVWAPLLFLGGHTLAAPLVAILTSSPESLAITAAEAALHDQRSVLNIIWSCITTIFACCWVAVHPNMVGPDPNFWQSSMNRFRHMIWMIIAPELMIFWAIRQWLGARKIKNEFNRGSSESNKKDKTKWMKTHGYFLQMGGFVLQRREGDDPEVLCYEDLKQLLSEKKIELPKISEGEIQDRSKLDGLSKTVAVGQTTWFVGQCITRKIQGLITTELELVTVAFAVLNVFIYFFWWNKPMDVRHPVPVLYLEEDEKHEDDVLITTVTTLSRKFKVATSRPKLGKRLSSGQILLTCVGLPWKGIKLLFRRVGAMTAFYKSSIKPRASHVPRFYALKPTDKEHCVIMAVVAAIGSLFGALHCIGWNYIFPSHAEAIIWRVSSVIITGVPAVMAFKAAALYPIEKDENGNPKGGSSLFFLIIATLSFCVGVVGVLPYIIARLLLIVEAFISLRQLPPSALLAVRWTAFLPHV